MNLDNIAEAASKHKGPVIAGSAAALLLLIFVAHRRAKANAASSTAGPVTADGTVTVPYDTSSGDASGGGITTGTDAADIAALTAAITGLTTSVNNLDPTTGDHNDGTDGAGQPTHLRPISVHPPKQPTPQGTKTGKRKPKTVTKTTTAKATHGNKPPRKQAPRPPKKTAANPRRPGPRPRTTQPIRPTAQPIRKQ